MEYPEDTEEPAQEGLLAGLTRLQHTGDTILSAYGACEGYLPILIGGVIIIQQFIIYLMYVRIRQLLEEIDSIEGKIKITDTELESLISRVEEFKDGNI